MVKITKAIKPKSTKKLGRLAKKLIICVSIFSGMDLFLFGLRKAGAIPGFACETNFAAALMIAANFKYPSGKPIIEFIPITDEEVRWYKKKENDKRDEIGKIDGVWVRTKSIEEYTAKEIRGIIEREFGNNFVIILIGGPPCQDWTKLNTGIDKDRKKLVFEYLRILKGLNPEVALMEEVPDMDAPRHKDEFELFLRMIGKLNFRTASLKANALHYEGFQDRERYIFMFIRKDLNKIAVFPIPMPEKAKRVRDFLDIDYFHSGHFEDKIKTKNYFMCTVTSGSPAKFYYKNGKTRAPRIDELLKCHGLENPEEFIIPEEISKTQLKKAIGNAVPVNLAYHFGKVIIEIILKDLL